MWYELRGMFREWRGKLRRNTIRAGQAIENNMVYVADGWSMSTKKYRKASH